MQTELWMMRQTFSIHSSITSDLGPAFPCCDCYSLKSCVSTVSSTVSLLLTFKNPIQKYKWAKITSNITFVLFFIAELKVLNILLL